MTDPNLSPAARPRKMRQPTPVMRLLAWHRAALAGRKPEVHDGWPECGWFKYQAVRNGPWIPITVWCQQDVDEHGELTAPETIHGDAWGTAIDPAPIWNYLKPISKAEHDALVAHRKANQHILSDTVPIDLGRTPTPPPMKGTRNGA